MNSDDLLDFADGAVLRGTSYRVSKRLGAGGMGAVYEGEHVKLRRRVCIKMIHPGLRGRDDFLQRMEIEAQTLARLDHPGIVKVFDLGVTDDGIPYFVMEKLEGKDLRRLLRSRRFFALPDALAIMKDVLEALAHAHREGVVHRDIKPENVFLSLNGADTVTKVLDFGIAHVADDRRGLTGERFLGTCQYAAPEQLRGEPASEKTDIYAAGCVLFELIAGRRPFLGPTTPDIIRQHLEDAPPRLSSLVPVPERLDALVASALAKDPSERPVTALWFAAQLHQIAQTAEHIELATANTTEEMLLTALTAGAPSSAGANDTVRDVVLPFAVGETTPQGPRTEVPGEADAAGLGTAPLDFRQLPTRSGQMVPRLRTEELTSEEHHRLEGRDVARAESPPEPSDAMKATTGGAAMLEARPESSPRRTSSWRRRALIASPIVLGAVISALILAFGRTEEQGERAPRQVATSPRPSAPSPSAAEGTATAVMPARSADAPIVSIAVVGSGVPVDTRIDAGGAQHATQPVVRRVPATSDGARARDATPTTATTSTSSKPDANAPSASARRSDFVWTM